MIVHKTVFLRHATSFFSRWQHLVASFSCGVGLQRALTWVDSASVNGVSDAVRTSVGSVLTLTTQDTSRTLNQKLFFREPRCCETLLSLFFTYVIRHLFTKHEKNIGALFAFFTLLMLQFISKIRVYIQIGVGLM